MTSRSMAWAAGPFLIVALAGCSSATPQSGQTPAALRTTQLPQSAPQSSSTTSTTSPSPAVLATAVAPSAPSQCSASATAPNGRCLSSASVSWLPGLPDPSALDWQDADEVAKAYVITYHTWDASKDENQEYAAVRAAIYETGDFSRTQALDPESAQASKEFLPLKTDGARTTATVERVTTEGADTNPQRPNGTWQRNIFYAREYPDGRFNTQRGVGWITLTRGEGGSWFVSDAKWTTL